MKIEGQGKKLVEEGRQYAEETIKTSNMESKVGKHNEKSHLSPLAPERR